MVGDGHWRPCDTDRPLQHVCLCAPHRQPWRTQRHLPFKFDPNTGHLTPNSPPRVGQPTGTGPRHFCFHPSKDLLYFSNEQGSSVTGYNFDPAHGTLSAFQTISTLPTGYEQSNTCSQIQMSPSGKFLYAPNRGHNSIAGFSVDAASGRLTAIGHVSTEARPSAFSLDPEGHFLFAAGSETDRLASYRSTARPVLSPPWRRIPWARDPCGY